jgi:hypothetical protein
LRSRRGSDAPHPATLPAGTDEAARDRPSGPRGGRRPPGARRGRPRARERQEELGPEVPASGVADGTARHLALASGRDAGRDHDGPGHDPASHAAGHVGGVGEQPGELGVVQAPGPHARPSPRPGRRRCGTPRSRGCRRPRRVRRRGRRPCGSTRRAPGPASPPRTGPGRSVGDAPGSTQKKLPWPSSGILRATSPASVVSSRSRWPFRRVVRVSVRSQRPAPACSVASASISAWEHQLDAPADRRRCRRRRGRHPGARPRQTGSGSPGTSEARLVVSSRRSPGGPPQWWIPPAFTGSTRPSVVGGL